VGTFQLVDFLTGYAVSNALHGAATGSRYRLIAGQTKELTSPDGLATCISEIALQFFLNARLD
jgi:hypothetical protein